jgi:hypothetical protein
VTTPLLQHARVRKPALPLRADDRRRHQRVAVALLGRYMLANRLEYPCQTVDMSPGGVRLTCAVSGAIGERIVMYIEHIGRLEGEIARYTQGGFAAALSGTWRKRDKIASQLTWLANRATLGLPEDRRHERVTLRQPFASVQWPGGSARTLRVIDCSLSGAALSGAGLPPAGTPITVGRTPCRVVRHFQGGAAVEFLLPLSPDRLDENLVL